MRPEEAAVCGHEASLLSVLRSVVPPAAGSRISAAAGPPAGPHRDGPAADPRSVLSLRSELIADQRSFNTVLSAGKI